MYIGIYANNQMHKGTCQRILKFIFVMYDDIWVWVTDVTGEKCILASHWKWDLDFYIGVWIPPETLRLIFFSAGCVVWSVSHGGNPGQRLLENLDYSCGFHVQSTLRVAEEGKHSKGILSGIININE